MDTKQIRKNMNANFDGNDIEFVAMEMLCKEVDTLRNENDAQTKEIERLREVLKQVQAHTLDADTWTLCAEGLQEKKG